MIQKTIIDCATPGHRRGIALTEETDYFWTSYLVLSFMTHDIHLDTCSMAALKHTKSAHLHSCHKPRESRISPLAFCVIPFPVYCCMGYTLVSCHLQLVTGIPLFVGILYVLPIAGPFWLRFQNPVEGEFEVTWKSLNNDETRGTLLSARAIHPQAAFLIFEFL